MFGLPAILAAAGSLACAFAESTVETTVIAAAQMARVFMTNSTFIFMWRLDSLEWVVRQKWETPVHLGVAELCRNLSDRGQKLIRFLQAYPFGPRESESWERSV